MEWGILILEIGYYQLRMALEGYFVRGGVSLGDVYVGEDMVFGPALVEAYELEDEKAENPRILLSPDVTLLIQCHMSYYAKEDVPQQAEILLDSDNRPFISYLYLLLGEKPETVEESILQHKNQIERLLRTNKNSKVFSKYQWVAHYHNFFCKNFLKNSPKDWMINLGVPQRQFKFLNRKPEGVPRGRVSG